jgi:calcium-dependent protein kinase
MNSLPVRKEAFVDVTQGSITDYVIVQKLGEGTFGSVFLAQHTQTKQQRAIKQIPKTRIKRQDRLQNEVNIMRSADHPNIVKLFEVREDRRNVYLIQEYCEGGELFDYILSKGHLNEKEAANLFRQVLSAIRYLHHNNTCHRDLKPENILFVYQGDDAPLKLIDFGLARMCENDYDLMSSQAGTPFYISPEILKGSYGKSTDLWSAGVILYIMLCGYPPFYAENEAEILRKVRQAKFSFTGPEWRQVSAEVKDLITKLLKPNPEERLTVDQAMEHPWLIENTPETPLNLVINTHSLRDYLRGRRLKKAVLICLASQCTERDVSNLRNIFMDLDKKGNGTVTLNDLKQGVRQYSAPIGADIEALINSMQASGEETIDYTSFLAATLDRSVMLQEDRLYNAFVKFDKNNTGLISVSDLKEVLGSEESEEDEEFWNELIREADSNGDGVVIFT